MKDKLRKRLSELQQELQKGEQMLSDLRAQQTGLKEGMLRIAGAIQVLEEILEENEPESDTSSESEPDGSAPTTG